MHRFTRFTLLRALWARARTLMAWLGFPVAQQARLRAFYWQRIQVAERQIRDGIVRGARDPDSSIRPQMADRPDAQAPAWPAQWEAQRQWYEAQRQVQQQQQQRRR